MEIPEEKSNLRGRPAVSTNLDPWDLLDTEPPTRQHTPTDMRPQHTYSRGLPGLDSVKENAPNPEETGSLRQFRGLVGWGHPHGDRGLGRRYGMWNSGPGHGE